MSGEITVTRGYVWSAGERVDYAKVNQTGAPTARLDEDAVTTTELLLDGSGAAVDTALAGAIVSRNLFRNPSLTTEKWINPDDGVTAAAGEKTENALPWWVNPEGADVLTKRSIAVPAYADGGRVGESLEIQGAADVTTVDIGQYLPSWVSGPLVTASFTVSVWIYNATGSSFTPSIRVSYPTSATDGFDALTFLSAATNDACANQEWTLVSETFDGTALTQIADGMQLTIRIPSGQLGAAGRLVRLAQFQLTPAASASAWVPPLPAPILHEYNADRAPGANDDAADGFSIGSRWHHSTAAYLCLDAAEGAAVWSLMTLSLQHIVNLQHQEASGTAGGTATAGSWETRPINTIAEDTGNLSDETLENPVAIDANGAFTLPAGLWQFDITVPFHACNAGRARLYNVDDGDVATYLDGTTEIYGTSIYASSANGGSANSVMRGRLQLTAPTKLRVEGQVGTSQATIGMGYPASLGTEVYTQAIFTLISL